MANLETNFLKAELFSDQLKMQNVEVFNEFVDQVL